MDNLVKQKLLDAGAVPRYTSYPTAPHFTPTPDDSSYKNWLKPLPEGDKISFYIHIPYCRELCYYCGCNTKITKQYKPIDRYLGVLKQEITLLAQQFSKQKIISQIHFGGGTPTILEPHDFDDLMQHIRDNFICDDSSEIAIEIDPRTITPQKIESYANNGVNRASLGVQDFEEKVQIAINRVQPFEIVKDTVDLLRKNGIDAINFDMIYGLPLQDMDNFTRSMELALTLRPSRFAIFGYAHVPWMKKHMQLIDESTLPNSELRFELANMASNMVKNAGYQQIGIDHFVLPSDNMYHALQNGTLQRNFQGYTTDQADTMLAVGITSIGMTPSGYFQNSMNSKDYRRLIESGQLAVTKICSVNDDDIMRREIINQIMCYQKIDLSQYNNDFTHEIKLLQDLIDINVVKWEDNILEIPKESILFSRVVASKFDKYFQQGTAKHSKAV